MIKLSDPGEVCSHGGFRGGGVLVAHGSVAKSLAYSIPGTRKEWHVGKANLGRRAVDGQQDPACLPYSEATSMHTYAY